MITMNARHKKVKEDSEDSLSQKASIRDKDGLNETVNS